MLANSRRVRWPSASGSQQYRARLTSGPPTRSRTATGENCRPYGDSEPSPNVVFNAGGCDAEMSLSNVATFNSAYLNTAVDNDLAITVVGLLNGIQEGTKTLTVNATSPSTLETFDWQNINELEFRCSRWTTSLLTGR